MSSRCHRIHLTILTHFRYESRILPLFVRFGSRRRHTLTFGHLMKSDRHDRGSQTMEQHILNTIDAGVLGERLADARRARNLTQQAAADALGVSRTTITAMEKGDRRPRASELVSLARLYGAAGGCIRATGAENRPPRDSSSSSDPRAARRPANAKPTSGNSSNSAAGTSNWRKCSAHHCHAAILPPTTSPEPRPERAAEEVATSERNRLGLGDAPVGDLWAMLETDVGLRVFPFGMEDRRIAGMYLYYGGIRRLHRDQREPARRSPANERRA